MLTVDRRRPQAFERIEPGACNIGKAALRIAAQVTPQLLHIVAEADSFPERQFLGIPGAGLVERALYLGLRLFCCFASRDRFRSFPLRGLSSRL